MRSGGGRTDRAALEVEVVEREQSNRRKRMEPRLVWIRDVTSQPSRVRPLDLSSALDALPHVNVKWHRRGKIVDLRNPQNNTLRSGRLMHGARCYAANAAINATSALQLTSGRATGCRAGPLAINFTRRSDNIRLQRCRQSRIPYTTTAEGATKRANVTLASEAIPGKDTRQAQRLALYEEVMVKDGTTHLNEEQKRQQMREAARIKQTHHEGSVDWKTHSLALSEQIRKARRAHHDPAPKDGEWAPPAPQMFLDYTGLVIEPQTSNADPPMPIPWAQSYKVRKNKVTAAQILDLEITAFADHMAPTAKEKVARHHVRNSAEKILGTLDGHQSYAFGSHKTGLAMPYSDIDIGIFEPKYSRHALQPAMRRLYSLLNAGEEYICVVYRPARRSIITAQHKATGIDIQIVARESGFQDMRVQGYLETIPHLYQLYSVMRTAFGVRGFVDPFIGGISSYGTFMMLAAALTRRGTPLNIHNSPSSQLLHFLSFWANFDTTKYGIALSCPASTNDDGSNLLYDRPAKLFRKVSFDENLGPEKVRAQQAAMVSAAKNRQQNQRAAQYRIGRSNPEQPYLLCMQDPASPINDLGGTCHAIKHILQTIKAMHANLVRAMEEHDRTPPIDRPKGETSFLLPLVGRSHELYAERRQRLREWQPSRRLRWRQIDSESKWRAKNTTVHNADGIKHQVISEDNRRAKNDTVHNANKKKKPGSVGK
jgi:non-canonical poly(A) RNA polymerase PAPD5/7